MRLFKSFCFSLSLIILIIDQYSKYIVSQNIGILSQNIELFPFLNLVYVTNKGISFGILSELDISFYLGILSLIISLFIILWILKLNKKREVVSLSMILGGALGNGIDRVFNSYVIDFIDFHIEEWHWPAFNFADSFITVGAIIFIFSNFFNSSK